MKQNFGRLCYRARRAWAKALMENWDGQWEPIPRKAGGAA